MIDLVNVTQTGTVELYIPDATIPYTKIPPTHAGDTVCLDTPGGILFPGTHTMTLSATGGLSMGIDGLIFTSRLPLTPVITGTVIDPTGLPPSQQNLYITASPDIRYNPEIWSMWNFTMARILDPSRWKFPDHCLLS